MNAGFDEDAFTHSLCVTSKRNKCTRQRNRKETDVETALAALAGESDIDLEETDVQEILRADKGSRQLRGEQRVNRGYRPVRGHRWRETISS